MRRLMFFLWMLIPFGAVAYHYGPGQERLRADRAADAAARGKELASEAREISIKQSDLAAVGTWKEAEKAYGEALDLLPSGSVDEGRALRLERAKAQMMIGQLPDARGDLEILVDELATDPKTDPKLLSDARSTLANAEYYMTWLMRLEGSPRDDWESEIEASRQNYKLVAEQAEHANDAELAAKTKENLEASIRLARLELKDLQGMPLPSQ